MGAPYPAASIANAFLNKAAEDRKPLSHMKLQKLVYYAAGYFLAAYGIPLIDRAFEAWDYGPVVPDLYGAFKNFGNKPITRPATEMDWDVVEPRPVPIPTDDARVQKVIAFVWKTYGSFSALELSDMTHAEGSPWDETKKSKPGIRNADIENEILKKHFSQYVKKPTNA